MADRGGTLWTHWHTYLQSFESIKPPIPEVLGIPRCQPINDRAIINGHILLSRRWISTRKSDDITRDHPWIQLERGLTPRFLRFCSNLCPPKRFVRITPSDWIFLNSYSLSSIILSFPFFKRQYIFFLRIRKFHRNRVIRCRIYTANYGGKQKLGKKKKKKEKNRKTNFFFFLYL